MNTPEPRNRIVLLMAVSAAYFALCVGYILPHFNGVGFFRFRQMVSGTDMPGQPGLFSRIFKMESLTYLFELGAPNLYLFLLAPRWLIPAC